MRFVTKSVELLMYCLASVQRPPLTTLRPHHFSSVSSSFVVDVQYSSIVPQPMQLQFEALSPFHWSQRILQYSIYCDICYINR